MEVYSSRIAIVWHVLKYDVRCSNRARFWHDLWLVPAKGGFLFLVCVLGLGIDDKQLKEEGYNCYGVVFHVTNGEDMNHLFLNCSAALDLWALIF